MNFENKGIPIAVLKSKIKKRDDVILHYDENSRGRFPDEIDLRNLAGGSSSSFLPSQNERDVLYVCGKSGSGKSYHIKNYCLEFHKEHPKYPIYLISPKKDDTSFQEIKKYMTQLRLDDEFINTEIGLDDLTNSMIIFDDVESICDKRLREKVFKLLNLCMTCGRSSHVSVAVVSHCPTNGMKADDNGKLFYPLIFYSFGNVSEKVSSLLSCLASKLAEQSRLLYSQTKFYVETSVMATIMRCTARMIIDRFYTILHQRTVPYTHIDRSSEETAIPEDFSPKMISTTSLSSY
jgi:hypothetical protein